MYNPYAAIGCFHIIASIMAAYTSASSCLLNVHLILYFKQATIFLTRQNCASQTLALQNRLPADCYRKIYNVLVTPKLMKTSNFQRFRQLQSQKLQKDTLFVIKIFSSWFLEDSNMWAIVTENTFNEQRSILWKTYLKRATQEKTASTFRVPGKTFHRKKTNQPNLTLWKNFKWETF